MAKVTVKCGDCNGSYEAHSMHDCPMRYKLFSKRCEEILKMSQARAGISNASLADLVRTTLRDLPDITFDMQFNLQCKNTRTSGFIGPKNA